MPIISATGNLVKADFTVTFAIILSFVAFISPIFVAVINNAHNTKIKKLELINQMEQRQFDVYYSDKAKAFANLINSAGTLITEIGSGNSYKNIYIYFYNALLLCNEENQSLIIQLVEFVNKQLMSGEKPTHEWELEYLSKLSALTVSLNNELCTTADSIKKLHMPPHQTNTKKQKEQKRQ